MKLLISLIFLCLNPWSSTVFASDKISDLDIIAIYQIEDDEDAGFDFFTSQKSHKCGGKLSNRFRVYSDDSAVLDRKFQLVMNAFDNKRRVTVGKDGCEGTALITTYIGISQ